MKRIYSLLLTVVLSACLLVPVSCFAEEQPTAVPPAADAAQPQEGVSATEAVTQPAPTQTEKPLLTEIAFSGAQLVGEFHRDVFEYQLTVSDHSTPIRPSSYKATDYNAMVQVYYLTNTSGDAIGLVVRVFNQAGANEYKFLFDSIQEIKKTPDASLLSLNFDFGELSPKFDATVFRYTLYLPSDLEVLNINAVTSDENAKINTPSQIILNAGQPSPISIKVVSSDGTNTATYKLNIKRVDKTIAQIKVEMENPDFISFVEIPFYRTAPFYIGAGVGVFFIALALVLFFTFRRKKAAAPITNDSGLAGEAVPQPLPEQLPGGEAPSDTADKIVQEPAEAPPLNRPQKGKKKKNDKPSSSEEASTPAANKQPEVSAPSQEAPAPLSAKDAPSKPASADQAEPVPAEKDEAVEQPASPAQEAAPVSDPLKEPVDTPASAPSPATPPSKKRRSLFGKKKQSQVADPIAAPAETGQPASEPAPPPDAPAEEPKQEQPAGAMVSPAEPPDTAPLPPQEETAPAAADKPEVPASPSHKKGKKSKNGEKNDQTFSVNGLDLDKYKKYK